MVKNKVEAVEPKKDSEHKEYDKYEIESAAETLMKAEEIKENPELYKCCQEHMSKKSGHLASAMGKKPGSIEELKEIAKKKSKEESEYA